MSNDDVTTSSGVGSAGGASRRSPRQGSGGSPVGSTLSIVLAVVFVVVGFFILNDLIGDDSSSASGGDAAPDNSTDDTSTTIDLGLPSSTEAPVEPPVVSLVTEGATVVVANGNTIGGTAGRMSTELGTAGYNMGEAVDAKVTIEESIVYYDPGNTAAQGVAGSVATSMGGISVEPVPTPVPTNSGSLGEAGVLVVLGSNQADKTLETLAQEAEAAAPPELGSAPDVSGGTDAENTGDQPAQDEDN